MAVTIEKLHMTFATHGLSEVLVSNNEPAFISTEFEEFLHQNGVKHVTSAPYYPACNGLAERAVQTVKDGIKRMEGPLETRLMRFLFRYRVMPQWTTGVSPVEMLLGHCLWAHLDLLHPCVRRRVREKQIRHKSDYDSHS